MQGRKTGKNSPEKRTSREQKESLGGGVPLRKERKRNSKVKRNSLQEGKSFGEGIPEEKRRIIFFLKREKRREKRVCVHNLGKERKKPGKKLAQKGNPVYSESEKRTMRKSYHPGEEKITFPTYT